MRLDRGFGNGDVGDLLLIERFGDATVPMDEALAMRGVEFGAAGLVLLFGVGLLFGYIAAERVTCL